MGLGEISPQTIRDTTLDGSDPANLVWKSHTVGKSSPSSLNLPEASGDTPSQDQVRPSYTSSGRRPV